MSEPTFFRTARQLSLADIIALTGARAPADADRRRASGGLCRWRRRGRETSPSLPIPGTKMRWRRRARRLASCSRAMRLWCRQRRSRFKPTIRNARWPSFSPRFFLPRCIRNRCLEPRAYRRVPMSMPTHARRWRGDDPGAVIGPRAEIGTGTRIGPNAVVGPDVRIGRDCSIGASMPRCNMR